MVGYKTSGIGGGNRMTSKIMSKQNSALIVRQERGNEQRIKTNSAEVLLSSVT